MTFYEDLVSAGREHSDTLVRVQRGADPGFSAGGDLRMMADTPTALAAPEGTTEPSRSCPTLRSWSKSTRASKQPRTERRAPHAPNFAPGSRTAATQQCERRTMGGAGDATRASPDRPPTHLRRCSSHRDTRRDRIQPATPRQASAFQARGVPVRAPRALPHHLPHRRRNSLDQDPRRRASRRRLPPALTQPTRAPRLRRSAERRSGRQCWATRISRSSPTSSKAPRQVRHCA
jgi:hypothetical protein